MMYSQSILVEISTFAYDSLVVGWMTGGAIETDGMIVPKPKLDIQLELLRLFLFLRLFTTNIFCNLL